MKFCIGLNKVATLQHQQHRKGMVTNMTNEKGLLHHSRFPDPDGLLEFVLPGSVVSALLCNIVYREGFSDFK